MLTECYGEGAGMEALLRAFLAERDCDRRAARFWIAVYAGIVAAKPEGRRDVVPA